MSVHLGKSAHLVCIKVAFELTIEVEYFQNPDLTNKPCKLLTKTFSICANYFCDCNGIR